MNYPLILHENRLDDATPVADTTAAGYDVLNLREMWPFGGWKPGATSGQIDLDCGGAQACDYLALYNHDLGTQNGTITLQKSSDGVSYSNVDTHSPADDEPFVRLFTSTSARYWRVLVSGDAAPFLGILLFGERLTIPCGIKSGFDPTGVEIVGTYSRSHKGHPLGNRKRYEKWEQSPSFELLTQSWIRDTFNPAWDAHLHEEPFLFAWNATDYPKELWLVDALDKNPQPHRNGSRVDLKLDLRAAR